MARITIKLYTTIGKRLVRGKIPVEVSNIAEALDSMERHFGRGLRKEVCERDGSIRNDYVVTLNGHPLNRRSPEKTRVSDKDTLYIYPAVSGG
jgi:molybdopterin converting factor small subunit